MQHVPKEISEVTKKVGNVIVTTENMITPVKESLFKRFPILLTLLVTFGFTATLYGIEGMIDNIAWLQDQPFLIFILGISALLFTGKLYQKLG